MADSVPVRIPSPPQWYPNELDIPAAGSPPQQVAGARSGRVTLVIINTGAGVAFIRAVVDPSGPFITLASGASMSVDTTGEFYATSDTGCTLQTIETAFPPGEARVRDLPDFRAALAPHGG